MIITTRDHRKGNDTNSRLRSHIRTKARYADKITPGTGHLLSRRITITPELLDLDSLRSVQALSERLLARPGSIDVLILNAGIGGWTGVDWRICIPALLYDWVGALTWPAFKIAQKGLLTRSQSSQQDGEKRPGSQTQELALGQVFCSNLFGHYMLAHRLMPLLRKSDTSRIIWMSSLEAYAHSLSMTDFQGIATYQAYESCKRITDLLALSVDLTHTQDAVSIYIGGHETRPSQNQSLPKMYDCHPGITSTAIFPLPLVLHWCMTLAFYIARWSGSMWHTCSPYKAACAPVWLALTPQSTLDEMEARGGPGKWGSAIDALGGERVERTEVEGWGYGGRVGDARTSLGNRKGRHRDAKDLT